jgi:serine/threonine protein kinase
MPAPDACPAVRDLRRLVRARLDAGEAGPLRQHLERCARCREVLGAFEQEEGPAPPPGGAEEQTEAWTGGQPPAPAAKTADGTAELLALLAPPEAEDELGRAGPYRLLRVLGAGATGVVFVAEDVGLGRQVALKVMRPVPEANDLARQRFVREARATAVLESDHIVGIYQVGEAPIEGGSLPFLAMKLLQGQTLDERLKREGGGKVPSPLPVHEVLQIGREVAEGLAAAHDHGVIHRDIKPANIFLEALPAERGAAEARHRAKIVDFGLARAVCDDLQLTRTGTILGTPAYMSPEQARGARVDHRSDLFSLGAVLYRACTGRTPFQANDTMGMLLALAQDQPPPVQALNPDVPDELVGLINRLLAKMPEGRPQSAREVADALAALAARAEAARTAGQVPGRGKRERSPWWTVVQLAVVAGLAWGAYWYGPTVYRAAKAEVERIADESAKAGKR